MNERKFIGTWKLKSFEVKRADGSFVYPSGKNPLGYIMYNTDGYMSVFIVDENRGKFNVDVVPTKDFYKTIDDSKKALAFESFFSYCGHYEVKNDALIVHHLELCSIPDWVGTAQERIYKFSANILTLSQVTPSATAMLVWERV